MHKYHPAINIIIRIILLPIVAVLHAIPFLLSFFNNLYYWVRYGGEFLIHSKDDGASIGKIYRELLTQNQFRQDLVKELTKTKPNQ